MAIFCNEKRLNNLEAVVRRQRKRIIRLTKRIVGLEMTFKAITNSLKSQTSLNKDDNI